MTTRSIQVSMDLELLKRLDSDPETRRHGRSHVVRRALAYYLAARKHLDTDAELRRAYAGHQEKLEPEVVELIAAQAWPEDAT